MEARDYLFAYCERAGHDGLWSEPLNFITNAAFLLFAWYSYRLLKRQPDKRFRTMGDIWVLVVLMALIGLGSGLWHSWAAPGWTVMVDVIPIVAFINLYIISLYRRVAGFKWWQVACVWLGFTLANQAAGAIFPPSTLNGSLMYIPTFALMILSALYLRLRSIAGARELTIITVLFFASLTFRTLDLALCDTLPFGTHFLWHLFNSVVLYRLLKLLLPAK